jgi:ring-1,2-phenylacetyl-CoA epoxidase subunit PaaE
MAVHFHPLPVCRVTPDAAGSAAITLAVPPQLRAAFEFQPGQFLTLRDHIAGDEIRRSYSICSPRQRYDASGEIDIAIKPVSDGAFSRWALAQWAPGSVIDVMPPEGRFTPRLRGARHRVAFAAGSGITPVLSIISSTLAAQPDASFTVVYGNQRVDSIMFNEALQDLKDRYPSRLALLHLLSRQAQEVELLHGRIDEAKVAELLRTVLPPPSIDEVFLCGPEGMIDSAQRALLAAGVAADCIHAERFFTESTARPAGRAVATPAATPTSHPHRLDVVLDGKTHQLAMDAGDKVLDIALQAGLDLPFSCRSGVCSTCRARVLEGRVEMEKNFTLEPWEIAKGFVLTCQSHPLSDRLVVSFDER